VTQAPQLHLVQTRITDRSEVRLQATLHVQGRAMPFVLHNLSAEGFMGQAPRHVPLGALVVLELPGLPPFGSKIRWSVGHKAGGRFSQRLTDQQLALALGEEVATPMAATAA